MKKKIEELLKMYKSLNRGIRSYEENVILDGKLEVLEELLSNAEGEVKGWVSTSARNPTKQGYYHVLRGGSNPDSVHDSHPAVHFWYADKKEWSSQTDYWLDLSKPQKGDSK